MIWNGCHIEVTAESLVLVVVGLEETWIVIKEPHESLHCATYLLTDGELHAISSAPAKQKISVELRVMSGKPG